MLSGLQIQLDDKVSAALSLEESVSELQAELAAQQALLPRLQSDLQEATSQE